MKVVIDTNVIVSALWTDNGNPRKILDMLGRNELKICYDHRIMAEYEHVLGRPKFRFNRKDINGILNRVKAKGFCAIANECTAPFSEETDRAFYEVAVSCNAYLITGNKKHYPDEPFILSPTQFLPL